MSLLGWVIAQITKPIVKIAGYFGKYIASLFSKALLFVSSHIKFFLTAFIVFLCSLLRIQHSKIGLFVACKDYISQSYFHEPCKVVFHYPNVQSIQIKHDKEIEKKK